MSAIQSKFATVLGAALVAMVLAAPAASADVSFEVLDPATSQPCGEVVVEGAQVSGGCLIEMAGQYEVMRQNQCSGTFDMRIDSTGEFYGYNGYAWTQTFVCAFKPCDESAWAGQLRVPSSEEVVADMTFCLAHYKSGDEYHFPVKDAEFETNEGQYTTLTIGPEDSSCPLPAELQHACASIYPPKYYAPYFAGEFNGDGVIVYETGEE